MLGIRVEYGWQLEKGCSGLPARVWWQCRHHHECTRVVELLHIAVGTHSAARARAAVCCTKRFLKLHPRFFEKT